MKKEEDPKKEPEKKEEAQEPEKKEETKDAEVAEEKKEEELAPLSDNKEPIQQAPEPTTLEDKQTPLSTPTPGTPETTPLTPPANESANTEPKEAVNTESPLEKPATPLEANPINPSITSSPLSADVTPLGEEVPRDPDKKYADSYPLADEIEKNALKKNGGGFLSSLISFKNKRIKLLIGLIVVVLLVVLGVGTFLNNKNQPILFFGGEQTTKPTQSTTPTSPPPSPTPTTADIDKAELSIQVLNGSGTRGVAGTVKDILVENGYNEEIATGNADSYDYTETVIQVKKGRDDIFSTIKEDLENDYTIAAKPETLPEDSEYDAVVIVGQE